MILDFQQKVRRLFLLLAIVLVCNFVLTPDATARMGKSIFDGEPTEEQCRLCHGDNANQPHSMLQTSNADRHHALIGKHIEGLYYDRHDTVAPGDTSRGEYHCLTCHTTKYSEETGEIEMMLTNDCLQCHPTWSVTGSPMRGANVHHAQRGRCNSCHGFLNGKESGRGGRGGGMRGR